MFVFLHYEILIVEIKTEENANVKFVYSSLAFQSSLFKVVSSPPPFSGQTAKMRHLNSRCKQKGLLLETFNINITTMAFCVMFFLSLV